VATDVKSQPESIERSREVRCGIDEKGCVVGLLFLAEFTQEQHGELRGSRRKQPYVEKFVRCGIDGRIQPVSFVVDLNYRFVDCDVIWRGIAGRLKIGLLDPIVNRSSTAATPNISRYCLVFESDRPARCS